jgi:16S rRNA G1207 methylase RsmC
MKLITILALSLATAAFGAEVKIEGDAKCGKCSLKKSEECHTVVVTKDAAGKDQVYWVKENDQSKALHTDICTTPKAVTVWGDAGEKSDGTKTLTITKFELKK